MTRTSWGYLYWSLWIGVGFLVPELLGWLRFAPWPTFSETVWRAETHWLVAPCVFALLLALVAHFLYHRPLWASLLFGVIVAAAAHLADRAWP